MKHRLLALADEKFLASDFRGATDAIQEYMELFPIDPEQGLIASITPTNDKGQRLHLKNDIV